MLLLASVLTPLCELFDTWDAPGPAGDTETMVLGFVLMLCLVLVVCKLLACLRALIGLIRLSGSPPVLRLLRTLEAAATLILPVPLHASPPLRI